MSFHIQKLSQKILTPYQKSILRLIQKPYQTFLYVFVLCLIDLRTLQPSLSHTHNPISCPSVPFECPVPLCPTRAFAPCVCRCACAPAVPSAPLCRVCRCPTSLSLLLSHNIRYCIPLYLVLVSYSTALPLHVIIVLHYSIVFTYFFIWMSALDMDYRYSFMFPPL
jgi:hypothetical protein